MDILFLSSYTKNFGGVSVQMDTLRTCLAQEGLSVESVGLVEELADFDEVCACGTAVVLTPVSQIDDPDKGRSYTFHNGQVGPVFFSHYLVAKTAGHLSEARVSFVLLAVAPVVGHLEYLLAQRAGLLPVLLPGLYAKQKCGYNTYHCIHLPLS